MTVLIVNVLALILIAAIIWWFWLAPIKTISMTGKQIIDISVENGVYTPANIEVTANQKYTLRFLRKDPSPCAEKVLFEGIGKSLDLPLGLPVEIEIILPVAGEYGFSCDMKMYHGRLVATAQV
ncbi:MAG: cupredoxin domain-containing protein [Gammaproteobacteria bacterium]|nr:cupredoxin domain-containing protein [Gammaproteobacteria bacterium]